MKLVYIFRVCFISIEFFILLTWLLLFTEFKAKITELITGLTLSSEVGSYLILLPIAIFINIYKDSHQLLFAEKENIKLLVRWPDYWKLKTHVYVSLFYGAFYLIASSLAWFYTEWINNPLTFITFISACIGLICVASSIYFAKMSILELTNQ